MRGGGERTSRGGKGRAADGMSGAGRVADDIRPWWGAAAAAAAAG